MIYNVNGNILYDSKNADFADNMTLDYAYDAATGVNYTVVRVFQTKKDGTKQYPFVRSPGRMSAVDLRDSENWCLIMNAGLGVSAEQPIDGVLIENGVVKNGDPATYHVGSQPLTIDADGALSYAAADATGSGLIAGNVSGNGVITSGIVSACCGFCPIIVDFEPTQSFPAVNINGGGNHFSQNAARQIIGQFGNGDYAIISCGGNSIDNSDGWTLAEAQTICQKIGVKFAYNLDGGGSVNTIISKKRVNMNYYASGQYERLLPSFIVFNGSTRFAVPS